MPDADIVNVRYLVDDVAASVDFYTRHFGFTVGISSPAFADVTLGNLRLLLSGPQSSAGRPMTDRERPGPGGWNRIHLIVDDLDGEIARLTCVTGGGQHLQRPAGAGDHHSRCGHVESFHAAVSEQGEGVDDIEVIDEVVGQVDHRPK